MFSCKIQKTKVIKICFITAKRWQKLYFFTAFGNYFFIALLLYIFIETDTDIGAILLEEAQQFLLHIGCDEDGATLCLAIGAFADIGRKVPEMRRIGRRYRAEHAAESACHAYDLLLTTIGAALLDAGYMVRVQNAEHLLRLTQLLITLKASTKVMYRACILETYRINGMD